MKIKIGNNYSKTQNISSGVPQRLILETLFLMLINDLPNKIKIRNKTIC